KRECQESRRRETGAIRRERPVRGRYTRGYGGDVVPAVERQPQASSQIAEGFEAGHAHRLEHVRHGRLEAGERNHPRRFGTGGFLPEPQAVLLDRSAAPRKLKVTAPGGLLCSPADWQ